MPRVKQILSKSDLAPEYHAYFDQLLQSRGTPFGGPQSILLHDPEVSRRVADLGDHLRFKGLLKPQELELAILTVAREKDCAYIWGAHAAAARKAGVPDQAVEAIRGRGEPPGLDPDGAAIVSYTRQLLGANRVDQGTFARLQNRHGVQWLVQLTSLVGWYGLLAGVLNAFEVPAAAGAAEL